MTEPLALKERLLEMTDAVVDRAVNILPNVLGAVALLLLGWVLAKLLRAASHRLLQWSDSALEQLLGQGRASRIRLARSANVLGSIVFWAVMLLFITAATQALGLATFTAWLASLVDHLPTLLAGILILAVGYLLSRFAADFVLGAVRLPTAPRLVLARAAQIAILVGALLVGADQMGIKVTFLAIFAGGIAVSLGGGAVVAISIGARQHVANLIGAQQVGQRLEVGQSIRVAGFEGRILEINNQGVLLESSDGRVSLPGHLFSEQPLVVLAPHGEAARDD